MECGADLCARVIDREIDRRFSLAGWNLSADRELHKSSGQNSVRRREHGAKRSGSGADLERLSRPADEFNRIAPPPVPAPSET
jgi:hypothetical protein